MPSKIYQANKAHKIHPPAWLEGCVILEVIMGSRAYGCNDKHKSDYDIRGIFIPPLSYIFPNKTGLIDGFDDVPKCEHWNESHIIIKDKEYDFDIHNIVKFFRLAEENNSNQIDMLFAAENMITHCTATGRLILDNRKLFLSKLCWTRYRGYAANQLHKIKNEKPVGSRKELVDKYGYDVKFGYHCYRLLRECQQILFDENLDLMLYKDEYKAIRNGEWELKTLEETFNTILRNIESKINKCKLPDVPDHKKLKNLLLECLEHQYGNLSKVVSKFDKNTEILREISKIIGRATL